jgi:hypothetical protein
MTVTSVSSTLDSIVAKIIGQSCCKVQFSYGDVLCLHFGEQLPYSQPAMAGKFRGAWVLDTLAADWQWSSGREVLASSSQARESVSDDLHKLIGLSIVAVKINPETANFILNFNDGSQFEVLGTPEVDAELAHWQLFTPNQQLLEVGAANQWRYESVDQPLTSTNS